MTKPPADYETRKRRRLERLGTLDPKCGHCGETYWACFELHHVAGRRNDDMTVLACNNCHDKLSNMQKDHPPAHPSGDPLSLAVGNFLLGLADMLRLIIEKLTEFGIALIERSNQSVAGEVK